jgi:hypothetical protein
MRSDLSRRVPRTSRQQPSFRLQRCDGRAVGDTSTKGLSLVLGQSSGGRFIRQLVDDGLEAAIGFHREHMARADSSVRQSPRGLRSSSSSANDFFITESYRPMSLSQSGLPPMRTCYSKAARRCATKTVAVGRSTFIAAINPFRIVIRFRTQTVDVIFISCQNVWIAFPTAVLCR